ADIRTGKRPRVTEAEIDERIDELIRSRDPQSASKGIELRTKREAVASAVVEPTTPEAVFCLLIGSDDMAAPLWGPEHTLLRVVAAWALLGPMYVKEFGPHIAKAFPDVARALNGALALDRQRASNPARRVAPHHPDTSRNGPS